VGGNGWSARTGWSDPAGSGPDQASGSRTHGEAPVNRGEASRLEPSFNALTFLCLSPISSCL
jgi:hypothetical protein